MYWGSVEAISEAKELLYNYWGEYVILFIFHNSLDYMSQRMGFTVHNFFNQLECRRKNPNCDRPI